MKKALNLFKLILKSIEGKISMDNIHKWETLRLKPALTFKPATTKLGHRDLSTLSLTTISIWYK